MIVSGKKRISHIWTRLKIIFGRVDFIQLIPMILLLILGIMFVYGTGQQVGSGLENLWKKQINWAIIGLMVWLILTIMHYRFLKHWAWLIYLGSIISLILVLIWGNKIFGARRWLNIAGISVQPSEFAKTAVLIMGAWLLSLPGVSVNKLKYLMAIAGVAGLPFLLILLQPDLGSSLVLVPLAAVLIFIAGIKWRFIIIGAVIAVSLLTLEVGNEYFKIYPLLKEYQLKRIMVFINPEKDIDNSGWHQYQAELAVGSGGMYGKGYLHGTQSMLGFLPETHTDFIFSVIAEETGFAGALAVIVLYTFLLFSALRAAIFARDDFGLYLAVGIAVIIFTHSVVNIGMSIRLMPVTGLPLPLLSYGGTFIVNTMIYLGILQSIYAHRRKGAEGRLQWRKSSQLID